MLPKVCRSPTQGSHFKPTPGPLSFRKSSRIPPTWQSTQNSHFSTAFPRAWVTQDRTGCMEGWGVVPVGGWGKSLTGALGLPGLSSGCPLRGQPWSFFLVTSGQLLEPCVCVCVCVCSIHSHTNLPGTNSNSQCSKSTHHFSQSADFTTTLPSTVSRAH